MTLITKPPDERQFNSGLKSAVWMREGRRGSLGSRWGRVEAGPGVLAMETVEGFSKYFGGKSTKLGDGLGWSENGVICKHVKNACYIWD